MYWNSGDKYEGEWKNDKEKRRGNFHWNSGNIYEGDFRNGTMEGKGIYYYNYGTCFPIFSSLE